MAERAHSVGHQAGRWRVRGPARLWQWRVVAGRIVVNAVAVAVVVAVMPGVEQIADHPVLGYLAIATIFGLINAFVKPAIQFVALPLLMGSLGLVVIFVNAVVFWLLDLLTRVLDTDGVGWVLLASLLLSALSFLLENIFGLVSPLASDRPEDKD